MPYQCSKNSVYFLSKHHYKTHGILSLRILTLQPGLDLLFVYLRGISYELSNMILNVCVWDLKYGCTVESIFFRTIVEKNFQLAVTDRAAVPWWFVLKGL